MDDLTARPEGFSASVPIAELIKLGAVDNDLFARTFFPKAAREKAPLFHKEIDELLENPRYRLVNLECFRGSAKTTKLRIFTAKRIAYALNKTILYVGASEGHAARSIQWLRAQIEEKTDASGVRRKPLFSSAFNLSPGRKWTDTEIEVSHGVTGEVFWVLGVGITGNIRGINFDDYRPSLIILDDIVTDENAATREQREKISDLVLGAIVNSLAPATEEPNAKVALLQTPLHPKDVSSLAAESKTWKTARFGCWTKETQDFPTDMQRSVWEARYPTSALRRQKKEAIEQNRLSIWLREMECRLTSPEICPFKPEWLKYRPEGSLSPQNGIAVLAIDPVPPPSDRAAKKNTDSDFEAQVVWRRVRGEYHLEACVTNRGHEPSWSVSTALTLARNHRVARIVMQNIQYERTLEWLLKQEMQRTGRYFMLVDTSRKANRQNKHTRIVGAFQGPASHGRIFVDASQTEFISQFVQYRIGIDHDDILDASANALLDLINPTLELGEDEYAESWDDSDIPKIRRAQGCP